ncbi:hypothetical protein DL771_002910 [Monosporascus sp. 5C6A]|nr:hypothetical protein DL771_002910 [Monosporascus sp. 5C6A]
MRTTSSPPGAGNPGWTFSHFAFSHFIIQLKYRQNGFIESAGIYSGAPAASWVRKTIGHERADSRTPQTIPAPSIASESVSRGDRPQSRISPTVANVEPEPHEPAAWSTPAVGQEPFPAPVALQPVSSAAQPPPLQTAPDAANPGFPGRLWTDAYDAIEEDDPRLVDEYKKVLHRELGGESSAADIREREHDHTDAELSRTQMVRLVEDGLKKTEKEASAKYKIQEGMRVVSSVKELVGTALKHAPEAAAAWGGVCLLLQASANRDGMAYVISRMDWYWNLSGLLLEENQERAAGLRGELEKHIVDLYKEFLSYQMKSVCSYYRNRATALFRDMVEFDNWAGAVQSIKDAEEAVQQDIDKYSTQDIRMSLNSIAKQAKSQCAQLQDVHQAIQENTKKQEKRRQDDKNEKCLMDLRLTDPRDDKQRIEDTKGGLFPGASNWILDHDDFRRWRDSEDSRLLWIKGDPGKGKTMLMITIVDELERQLARSQQPASVATVVSYFFCQGTNKDLNNATAVLRGLIYLLAIRHIPLVSHVRTSYDHAGSKLFEDANSFFALSKVLENMLRDESLAGTYLVVDALDECVADRERLLKLIARHAAASPRVKWIVSSRNRREIEQNLKMDSAGAKLSLEITQNAEQVSRAVNAYVEFKVSEVQSLQGDIKLRNRVREIMCKKANGTFLWVALVAQELYTANSWEVLQVVEEMPATLEELYDRMIEQIQQLKRSNPEFCRLVLSTVTLAYRPLHLAELGVVSGLPPEISGDVNGIREMVSLCGSFLTVQDDFVYVIHQSVKDYLNGKASGTIFPSGCSQIHYAIFSRSIRALSTRPLRRNIYGLRLGMLVDEVKIPNPDPLAGIQYSCVHWANHFCDVDPSNSHFQEKGDQVAEIIFRFIENYFLYWMEAVALLRSMSDGVASIRRLDGLLKI